MKNQSVTYATMFLALAWFGFLPQIHAVAPPPDGCYPNFTTAEGCDALSLLTTGAGNTGLGWRSLYLDTHRQPQHRCWRWSAGPQQRGFQYSSGCGGAFAQHQRRSEYGGWNLRTSQQRHNTAVGDQALFANTTGTENTVNGAFALSFNTDGSFNTAIGAFALANNTGSENTAMGVDTLFNNTAGGNTAVGARALRQNTTGFQNVAVGHGTLNSNVAGSYNTALGKSALALNTGDGNTANR